MSRDRLNPAPDTAAGRKHATDRTSVKGRDGSDDSIEISHAARLRLARLADQERRKDLAQASRSASVPTAPTGEAEAPSAARTDELAEIKRRIATGYYDRPEVRDGIAGRLADRWSKLPGIDE